MPRPQIPQRQPISDVFSGVLFTVETLTQSWGFLGLEAPNGIAYRSGDFIIRYGVRFLGKPHISIVPGLVASDYGDMMVGEMAWEFIYKKGFAFPRADVIGYRNDGTDDMMTLKFLDIAIPPQVLIYENDQTNTPLMPITALIASSDVAKTFPARLLDYLPRFDTIEDWNIHK
ncbi:MAG: hypothetical protein MUE54_13955 [Anaerolineae bacterium]|nr:hypothetical protein [Anaerolineae bacterium]